MVRAGHEQGTITVTATADGCEPTSVPITVRHAASNDNDTTTVGQ